MKITIWVLDQKRHNFLKFEAFEERNMEVIILNDIDGII